MAKKLEQAVADGLLAAGPGQQVVVHCRTENGGFGTGHNTVLSLLQSRVHFILNPDIQLTADTLSDLADWMAAHPDAVMARPSLVFPDGKPQQLPLRRCALRPMLYRQLPRLSFWKGQNDHYLMLDEDLTRPIEIEFCTGSFSGVRTSTFKAVGGFDESYFMYVEDADLTQKMRTRGKVYLVPQYTAIHAWHRAAHRSLKPFLWQLRSCCATFPSGALRGERRRKNSVFDSQKAVCRRHTAFCCFHLLHFACFHSKIKCTAIVFCKNAAMADPKLFTADAAPL